MGASEGGRGVDVGAMWSALRQGQGQTAARVSIKAVSRLALASQIN